MDSSKILKQRRIWNKQRLDGPKPKRHQHQDACRKKASIAQYWNQAIATDIHDWSLGNMYEQQESDDSEEVYSFDTPRDIGVFSAFVKLAEDVVGGRDFIVNRFSEQTKLNRRSYIRLGDERSEVNFRIVLRETTPLSNPEIWFSLRTEQRGEDFYRDQTMRVFRPVNTLVEYLDAVLSDIILIPREVVSVISSFCNESPIPHEECRVSMGEGRCPYFVCMCSCSCCCDCSPKECVCYRRHGIQCEVTSSDARNALFLREKGHEMTQLVEYLFVEEWNGCFGGELNFGWLRRENMMDLMDFVGRCAMDARVSTTRIKLPCPEGQSRFVRCEYGQEERLRLFDGW